MKIVFLRILMLSLAAAVGTAWAALRICGSCGHEAEGDEPACLHCGAALPAPTPDPATPEPAPAPGPDAAPEAAGAAVLPDGLLESQVQATRALAERGAWWGALLYARNTAALAGLAGVPGVAVQREMELLQEAARRILMESATPCAACEGTGRQKKLAVTMKGDVVEQTVAGAVCSVCQGTGKLPARTTQDRLQRDEADARRIFDFEQRQRGLVAWQGIYLPANFSDRLEPRQIAALRKGFGVWCEHCGGFRRIGCETCKGVGHTPCTASGCVQGRVVCDVCGGRGRTTGARTDSDSSWSFNTSGGTGRSASRTASVRCEACNGIGIRNCEECNGAAIIRCRDCKGEKDTLCRACNGSGMPAVCTRCKGDGVQPCSRCRGTGKGRRGEPCEHCDGRGEVLCPACEGAGRGRR
jgi:hypothetical protein